jgi:hypothetical protein
MSLKFNFSVILKPALPHNNAGIETLEERKVV